MTSSYVDEHGKEWVPLWQRRALIGVIVFLLGWIAKTSSVVITHPTRAEVSAELDARDAEIDRHDDRLEDLEAETDALTRYVEIRRELDRIDSNGRMKPDDGSDLMLPPEIRDGGSA